MKRWILNFILKRFAADVVRYVEINLSIGALVTLAEAVKAAMPGSVITIKDNNGQEVIINVGPMTPQTVGEVHVSPAMVPQSILAATTSGPVSHDTQFASMPTPPPEPDQNTLIAPIKSIPDAMRAVGMAVNAGWRVRLVQPETSLIQFIKGDTKLNVYWTKNRGYSIATTLNHPVKGRNQMYRCRVSADLLRQILKDPRTHTGKGYRKK